MSKISNYLQSLADNKFDGDVEAARAWLSDNGKKGGETGVKHFNKVTKQTHRKYSKRGGQISGEKRSMAADPYSDKNITKGFILDDKEQAL